ncbi:MAG TPA: acyl-CoA dehydrogenase family protein, partial [Candidatus Binatia bacterium]|nr:acyl-CoA dehydrogenase family protein [Candidatus Binatia bacterium]
MDSFTDPDHELRGSLRSWAERNPLVGETDQEALEREACSLARRLGREGFMAYAVPRLYGGMREAVQARDLCVIREELAYFAALADVMFGVQALASQPIVITGTEEQKKKYLPPLARGETLGAFALTEPEAGSDASAIALRAKRVIGGYSLTGTKRFISNAGIAQTYIVFASTDPSAKAKGISAFIVEADSPGFTIKEKTRLLSPHPIGVLGFDDCFVLQERLLATEGSGLKIALQTL